MSEQAHKKEKPMRFLLFHSLEYPFYIYFFPVFLFHLRLTCKTDHLIFNFHQNLAQNLHLRVYIYYT